MEDRMWAMVKVTGSEKATGSGMAMVMVMVMG
jgi:hypothetical protein